MTGTVYALDNQHESAAGHHRWLSELFDEHSRQRVRQLPNWPPRRCLDVGAGGGSMSRWLEQAAVVAHPDGIVVAVDRDTRHVHPAEPHLRAVEHDFATGTVLPPEFDGQLYDLVYSRMTLSHCPNRLQLLADMAARVAPGGVVLVEDWAALRDGTLIHAPDDATAQLYRRWQRAVGETFDAAGADRTWGRDVAHPAMLRLGLVDVDTQVWAAYWRGGDPAGRLAATTTAQLHDKLVARGLTPAELDTVVDLVTGEPRLVVHGHPMYSTAGTKP